MVDSPVQLIVQDAPESPPHRPMISSIASRSAGKYLRDWDKNICGRSVLLTWAVPLHDNHDPILSYKILVRKAAEPGPREIDTGRNETRFLVTGLQVNTGLSLVHPHVPILRSHWSNHPNTDL